MEKQIGMKLGIWFHSKGLIEESQIDDIRYAFEIACSEFLEFTIILLYGISMGKIVETFLYIVLFQVLRNYFQGYHAKTIWKCFILTVGTYLVTMELFQYIVIDVRFVIIMMLFSLSIQLMYCNSKKKWKPMFALVVLHSMGLILCILQYPTFLQILVVINIFVSVALLSKRKKK